jgi:ribonuclease J
MSIKNYVPSKKDFWFLPLGGSNEIGMNINLFGHNKKWLMVDCGVTFHDRTGIEVIMPSVDFIAQQQEALEGIVITHAHEDHVGAIPYLWPYLRCPIYATPFTAEIVREKIADKSWRHDVELIEVPLGASIQIGDFTVEFVTITHSIPEPNVLYISTPAGRIVHTGDWKIDHDPLIGETTNSNRLEEIGKEGVDVLLCDSTSAFEEGHSGSESEVRKEIIKLIKEHPEKRITVACFASNVARVETALEAAKATGRKVALVGRSLKRMTAAATYAGYLKGIPDLIDPRTANKLPPKDVLLIATGSQGEPRAALSRMAGRQHPDITLNAHDVVFFSSRVIPGNEKAINALQNALVLQGIEVITSKEEEIHVSGHPAREELKQMYKWIKPKCLIPVHGEPRHLVEQSHLGLSEGIPMAVVPHNGSLIDMIAKEPKIIGEVAVDRWALDGNRVVPFNSSHLKERGNISFNGAIVALIYLNTYGEITHDPSFTLLGLCANKAEKENLISHLVRAVEITMGKDFDGEDQCKDALSQSLKKVVKQLFDKKPLVEVHLIVSDQ